VETANAPAAGVLPVAAATIGRLVKLTPLRRTIARRMQESHLASAPVTLTRLLDATELVALRGRILKALSADAPRPTYTDFLIMIVARALLAHPALNATYDGESLREYDAAHVAVAVDTDRGLLAPVIRDAQGLGLLDVARARAELAHRAVAGTPAAGDLDGGTFTLTNLGTLGVDSFTPIINPPQLAILGVGRIYSAPAAHEGEIKLREMMHLSLTFDHRFVDGAPAARFLQDVVRRIETPDLIWM
jgi:pyruvate dehydrogenase E2 component (dihydrolipoamide acetyltransferase)